MSLRAWGWGRIALACVSYGLLLAALAMAWMAIEVRRLARENPSGDFLVTVGGVSGTVAALLLLGPPLTLILAWLWIRRR